MGPLEYLDGVAERLKGIEGNSDGEQDVQGGGGVVDSPGLAYHGQRGLEKIVILERKQQAKVYG